MIHEAGHKILKQSEIRQRAAQCRKSGCRFTGLCWFTGSCLLPSEHCDEHRDSLGARMQMMTDLAPGDHVYRLSEPFAGVVVVTNGWLKTYTVDSDGTEQIVSFITGGELAGLEALEDGTHKHNAVALCKTSCCLLDVDDFAEVCKNQPDVLKEFLAVFGAALRKQEILAGNYSSTEKLAAFLMDLLARSDIDPSASRTLSLPMTHHDIASYLAMAPETLSRQIKRLIKSGLIKSSGKHLEIIDPGGLAKTADGALMV
ncbi:MAG: Crp/Fnr family transcriptional regulator [Gammaproteobacteria bacterium]|nr:Crp/Fnr family transcriptional regulator [Gammaproteobacteria bacterium]